MEKWKLVVAQSVLAGSLASIFSTAALAFAGRREAGGAAAPVNAISHWLWGDKALRRNKPDLAHTAVGYLTHHAAAIFWAALYAGALRDSPASRTAAGVIAGAAGASATACFVDYRLTPKRLTPGFKHRLSSPAMLGVYAAMALGLAAGALVTRNSYGDAGNQAAEEEPPEPERRVVRRVRAGSA